MACLCSTGTASSSKTGSTTATMCAWCVPRAAAHQQPSTSASTPAAAAPSSSSTRLNSRYQRRPPADAAAAAASEQSVKGQLGLTAAAGGAADARVQSWCCSRCSSSLTSSSSRLCLLVAWVGARGQDRADWGVSRSRIRWNHVQHQHASRLPTTLLLCSRPRPRSHCCCVCRCLRSWGPACLTSCGSTTTSPSRWPLCR